VCGDDPELASYLRIEEGSYNGGEVATPNVAEKLLGCRIHPPDDPC
jgi:hypothetical protein